MRASRGRSTASFRLSAPPRARYRVAKAVAKPASGEYLVWIEDLNGALSVTNDAEAVCHDLQAGFPGYRIIYRDSMGLWDELVHDHGRFTGFAPARTLIPESVK